MVPKEFTCDLCGKTSIRTGHSQKYCGKQSIKGSCSHTVMMAGRLGRQQLALTAHKTKLIEDIRTLRLEGKSSLFIAKELGISSNTALKYSRDISIALGKTQNRLRLVGKSYLDLLRAEVHLIRDTKGNIIGKEDRPFKDVKSDWAW